MSEWFEQSMKKQFLFDLYRSQQEVIKVRQEECEMQKKAIEHRVKDCESEIKNLIWKTKLLEDEIFKLAIEENDYIEGWKTPNVETN